MNVQAFTSAAVCLCALVAHAQAESMSWHLRSLPATSEAARPLLLQADGDAAPEWGVFDDTTLTVADISSDYPPITYAIPKDASLFDLRDSDRDGKPEIALVRAERLEYWRDASRMAQDAASILINHPPLAALSFGHPRPYALFVERRGEDFLSVPLGPEPPLWTLDGVRINPLAPDAEDALTLTQFHVWEAATPPGVNTGRTEFRISQVYERPTTTPGTRTAATRPGGTRRARDAGDAPSEDWPSFALSSTVHVLYALAPPDYRDTLIRIEPIARPEPGTPQRRAQPRRFPGILIAPQESGSDVNGDGFTDLLLWRAPGPGTSMDALVRAAQTGTWDVTLTVHLYEPATQRFAPRPIEWFKTAAPVMQVLEGGVQGPFAYMTLEDIDGNGRMDLICTGAGREIAAWRFAGGREEGPWLHTELDQPIESVLFTAHVPAYRWLGIARAGDQFHVFALPKQ